MRRRLLALIAVTLLGLGGPGRASAAETEAAPASNEATTSVATAEPSPSATTTTPDAPAEEPTPTGGPAQETSSTSDGSVSNDATVDQGSGQTQAGGDTSGAPSESNTGPAQSGQEAQTAQQVQADAAASSTGAGNDTASTRVGAGSAGDGGAVEQSSSARADAGATATQSTGQLGAGTSGSAGQQSAAASASARASDSTNTLVDTRIGASGDVGGFDQSVLAGAAARTELDGPDGVEQKARAAANAEVADARNTAVELRLVSNGDSAGGRQSISADAAATGADATALAAINNPFNTFVSIRVNSDGTTGPVRQDISERESVNGSISVNDAAADWTWVFNVNGVTIHFTSDGANTDLRIGVDDPTLQRPDQAPLFVWQWDMVFGAGSRPDCAISSSADTARVTWSFDCDPDNLIERSTETSPTAAPSANALSWAWSWLRPQLSAWSWDRNDSFLLPACGPTCSLLLDFRWLSLEPDAASVAGTASETETGDVAAAVQQTNAAAASATASAASSIEQTLVQSGGDQAALQQALVAQLVTAQAVAGLTDVDNVSAGIGAHVAQANRAVSEVTAAVGAEVVQLLSQQQAGDDAVQTQAALQSASTTQQLYTGSIATVSQASNRDVSVGGAAVQSSTSSASAAGVELAATRQVSEQEQQGDGSDQMQLVGQWADTAQQMEILAAAGVSDARISSTLNGDSADLRIRAGAAGVGDSKSTIHQLSLQLQSGDAVAQQQESYQTASVEQTGTTLAAASAGGTLRYVLVPMLAEAVNPQAEVFQQAALAPARAPALVAVVPTSRVLPAIRLPVSPSARPILKPLQPSLTRKQAAAPAAPRTVIASNDSASSAGQAGAVPKRAKDAERAPGGSPRGLCLASCNGAAAVSAGTGSGGAFIASSGYALSPVQLLGRRHSAPAGRRPAAVVLLRAKPG